MKIIEINLRDKRDELVLLSEFELGAILGCIICVFSPPYWFTPIIWIALLILLNIVFSYISQIIKERKNKCSKK